MSLDSLVENASKYDARSKVNTVSDEDLEMFGTPRIMVIGCGGAGNNTINRLYEIGICGAETIAINTDKQHLDMVKADKKVLIGKTLTRGLGAGGFPDIGRKAAEIARGTLEEILADVDMIFITAGMGGGTGTGSAPIVADVAKKMGAIVIGMVSTPFNAERARRLKAEEGLEELRKHADTVIVLDNNRLLQYVPNLPVRKAFSVMDQLIAETVKGITETITQPSLINLDFADIKAVMNYGGVASMLVGEAKSQDRVDSVVRAALTHPLLDVDYHGATGSLVHITGGPDLTLTEANEIVEALTYELDAKANVIWGARIDKDSEGKVKVMAIMTGVESSQILGPSVERSERAFVPRNNNPVDVFGIPKIC
ncbi:MAG TPA: cell division protein FtsZ [Candidatus Syntrophoarchaeum butanivorans]|uniref:Cell division protein FtsZ n=1 Tax=Candidatus Syntropharchaeum butanivorans TaxID=1839936 RepID=A0A7C0X350_9EURY|nr:MAG: cell division protein FtsZ [Candidatus Syntrophoarchaeum sp. WYZ-LMO15]HDM36531.1 cell division protein FtsZ [Candidatus Syntrophoarchaeum butanivorans]HEC56915.1 cell division protein FtsZ [Candidatus Syntrophoarchaeum butanivorans]